MYPVAAAQPRPGPAGAAAARTRGRCDTNFFASNWAGPPPTVGGIEKQGSAAMALNIYAMLCGSE